MTNTATELKGDSRTLGLSASAPRDAELYHRGVATLLAAWEQYAHASEGAAVHRLAGVAAAVFPTEPERSVYNNAVLKCALPAASRAEAIAAMQTAYANVGVTRYAAWVHERDRPMRADLERRGYTLDEVTRAMGMALDDIRAPRPGFELGPADWSEHLLIADVHPGYSAGSTPPSFMCLSDATAVKTSSRVSRSTFAPTAGYTTWGPWSRPADADSARR